MEPLTDAAIDRLRDLAASVQDGRCAGGYGLLPSPCYWQQGSVAVPSAWLIELIDRAKAAPR